MKFWQKKFLSKQRQKNRRSQLVPIQISKNLFFNRHIIGFRLFIQAVFYSQFYIFDYEHDAIGHLAMAGMENYIRVIHLVTFIIFILYSNDYETLRSKFSLIINY